MLPDDCYCYISVRVDQWPNEELLDWFVLTFEIWLMMVIRRSFVIACFGEKGWSCKRLSGFSFKMVGLLLLGFLLYTGL